MNLSIGISQLIARARALKSPRLLAATLATVLVGLLLAVLAGSMWLSAFGVFAATASIAALIVASAYDRQQEDVTRRAILASIFLGVIAVMAIFLWFQRPAAYVELKRIDAKPGAALSLSGVGSLSSGRGSEKVPFVEGSFGSIGIVESNPLSNEAIDTGAFRMRVPVASSACGRLEAELGGSCGDRTDSQLTDFHTVEIRTLDSDAPLSTEIRPANARTLELTKTTRRTQQRVPTEWELAHDSPHIDIDIQCIDGAPLIIKTLLGPLVRADCALADSTFQLVVEPAAEAHGNLFLREVGELNVHVRGAEAETIVEDADLFLDGSGESLPELPATVVLRAGEASTVELAARQSTVEKVDKVSLFSPTASSVRVGDEERVQNWLQRNVEPTYFIAGIFLAIFSGALFDFAFVKLNRSS